MDVYEAIVSRRSITRFKPDPIPREVLEKVLSAALWAPSKLDLQNWYFVVLAGSQKDRLVALLRAKFAQIVSAAKAPSLSLYRAWATDWFLDAAEQAPVLIAVFSEKPVSEDIDYGLSVAAAVQNLLLAAWNEGIGTRWYTSGICAVKEAISEHLGIRDKDLVGLVVMGYPAEIPEPTLRREGKIEWRVEP